MGRNGQRAEGRGHVPNSSRATSTPLVAPARPPPPLLPLPSASPSPPHPHPSPTFALLLSILSSRLILTLSSPRSASSSRRPRPTYQSPVVPARLLFAVALPCSPTPFPFPPSPAHLAPLPSSLLPPSPPHHANKWEAQVRRCPSWSARPAEASTQGSIEDCAKVRRAGEIVAMEARRSSRHA